jgi:hypothetical protein
MKRRRRPVGMNPAGPMTMIVLIAVTLGYVVWTLLGG